MTRVLMAAPYETKGRFQGGIMQVANSICAHNNIMESNDVCIEKFNTCRIQRTVNSKGKVNISNLRNSYRIYKDLKKEIAKNNYDALYYHTSSKLPLVKDLISIAHAKKNRKIHTILHIHFAEYNKILFKSKVINKIVIRMMNKYINKIVFLSEITTVEFINHGIDSSRTQLLYNFHSMKYSKEDLNRKISEFKKKRKVDLLYIGSLDRRKGILDLLHVLDVIDDDYVLHICGNINDNSIKTEFEQLIKKLENRIVFHGFVSGKEKEDIIINSDILILPTYGEGLPISIIEGLAAGCIIVSTKVGAIPEIITDRNGYLYEPGDNSRLIEILRSLIKDKNTAINIMTSNYENSKDFTIENFMNKFCDICKCL